MNPTGFAICAGWAFMCVLAVFAWGGQKTRAASEQATREAWERKAEYRLNMMLAMRDLLMKFIIDERSDPTLLDEAREILYGDLDNYWKPR